MLHTAQELFGFLQTDLLHYIAHGLKLPPSRVYGVATFYHFFSFAPQGRHTCVVCTGTACYVKGADALLESVERRFGTVAGETTADGQVSLMTRAAWGRAGWPPSRSTTARSPGTRGRSSPWSARKDGSTMDLDDLRAIAEKERGAEKAVRIRCCTAAGCLSSGSKAVIAGLEAAIASGRPGREGPGRRGRLHAASAARAPWSRSIPTARSTRR